ncbi:chorismate--pyruvate lyase family protein [Ideonella sp. BN130291]|uniref:chorismate--pyruvate lyase family protein n=1 Tax=Ideonella sp. BN130291 TaxID=3112940 RepID=UPI002E26E0F5|nr:chorismate lyase [Ideonella sp. BN130291]
MSALALRRWLQRTGSLSAHLQTLGSRFEVQRVSQRVAPLLPGEARSMGLPHSTRCVVRQVVLRVDGLPLVFARSVAPAHALHGPWRSLGSLGSKPLAQLLFDTPQVSRSRLLAQRIGAAGPWRAVLDKGWHAATGQAWPQPLAHARHSVFRKAGMPLRVTEVFAPAMRSRPCPQTMRTASRGKPSTSASSRSPACTAATPSGVPL